MAAAGTAYDRHIAQDRHDATSGSDFSAVDRWLEAMSGSAYPPAPGALPDNVIHRPAVPADANLPSRGELPPGLQPWP